VHPSHLEVRVPTNPFIYYGVVVITASACIWIGAELTRRIEWIVPWTGGFGLFLILIGIAEEARHRRRKVLAAARQADEQERR
jgi:hypothetical protein